MVLTGLIRDIFPTKVHSEKFRTTEVWISEVNAQYPNVWSVSFWNDDANVLKNYSTGTMVNVNIAVLGKLSTKNGQEFVYNTIRAVKIQKLK